MANVFVSIPGTVAVFPETGGALPGKISVTNSDGKDSLSNKSIMISGVDNKQSVDAQFQTSLERDIYAYVFGDNMGEILVHGRAYFPCDKGGGDSIESANNPFPSSGKSGYNDIVDFYAKHRMSKDEFPVKITIGDRTTTGYIIALLVKAIGLSDEPSGLVYDFGLNIAALPDDSG